MNALSPLEHTAVGGKLTPQRGHPDLPLCDNDELQTGTSLSSGESAPLLPSVPQMCKECALKQVEAGSWHLDRSLSSAVVLNHMSEAWKVLELSQGTQKHSPPAG